MVKYLFILFSFAFSAVTVGTNGNYHFTTIQEAIDSVTFNPIDTEINVYPGTYQENLLIESDMVILSMGDATNTIIDGSLGRGLGSTVVIRPGSGSPSKPDVEIDGFEITGGNWHTPIYSFDYEEHVDKFTDLVYFANGLLVHNVHDKDA